MAQDPQRFTPHRVQGRAQHHGPAAAASSAQLRPHLRRPPGSKEAPAAFLKSPGGCGGVMLFSQCKPQAVCTI